MKIALSQAERFNQLLKTTDGMSKRILAMRLNELERDGFIHRAQQTQTRTTWALTQKGADVLPVLLTLIHFGSKWRDPTAADDSSDVLGHTFDVTYTVGPSSARRKA
jgi:DNA-binding HxlR family transcriptional regulator